MSTPTLFYQPSSSSTSSADITALQTQVTALKTEVNGATDANSNFTLVKRDPTGGFAAATVKATTLEVSGTTKIAMPLRDFGGASVFNVIGDNTYVGKDIGVAGTFNTAVGTSALKVVTVDATLNTAVGVRCLEGLTTGTHNVAMGYRAGSVGTTLTTGTKCTLIGADARTSSSSMINSTAIGYTALVDADNTIQLGNNGVVAVKTSGTLYAAGLESAGATPTILNIASLNNTNTVNIGSDAGVQAINVGNNGTGKTTITLGGGTDEVKVNLPLKDSVNGFSILSVTSEASAGNTSLGSKAMASWTGTANTYIGSEIGSLGTGVAGGNTVVDQMP